MWAKFGAAVTRTLLSYERDADLRQDLSQETFLAVLDSLERIEAAENPKEWTPEGLLAFRLRECEVSLFGARSGLAACAVLMCFAAFVWLAAELGWDTLPPDFPRFYATVVVSSCSLPAALVC